MDNSFLKNSDPAVLQQVIARALLDVNTSIPGTVKSFNPKNQTVVATPNIRMIQNKKDGTTKKLDMPDLIEVPCIFPYSITSDLSLTFPVSEGDQCLLIFSQRSIDNWHELGGIQDPVEDKYPRAHSLSDAIAILGLIPKSEAIKNFSSNTIEIRNKCRSVRIAVDSNKIEMLSCSGFNPDLWDEEIEYISGQEACIESGLVYVAIKGNKGIYPPTDPEKWAEMPNSKLVMEGETITLKGIVIIDGVMSGVGGTTPVPTSAGILHKGGSPDQDVVIDKDHKHLGVMSGTSPTGGVQ